MTQALNVLGLPLMPCSQYPVTGYFRDGCCNTDDTDLGEHVVCAVMTEEFLEFSKSCGNDLSTPRPEYAFPGLQEGDRWCLCANRWVEALVAGSAPAIVMASTHEAILDQVSLETIVTYAIDRPGLPES